MHSATSPGIASLSLRDFLTMTYWRDSLKKKYLMQKSNPSSVPDLQGFYHGTLWHVPITFAACFEGGNPADFTITTEVELSTLNA